jgi:formate hydrogenlyase subunit 6/NADH:ubiquinone oxidoreductase subunit I
MSGGGGVQAGHRGQAAVSGQLAEMGRWLEDQGLSADALVQLLHYLRGLGAAPWTGAPVAAPARSGQRDRPRFRGGWMLTTCVGCGRCARAGCMTR